MIPYNDSDWGSYLWTINLITKYEQREYFSWHKIWRLFSVYFPNAFYWATFTRYLSRSIQVAYTKDFIFLHAAARSFFTIDHLYFLKFIRDAWAKAHKRQFSDLQIKFIICKIQIIIFDFSVPNCKLLFNQKCIEST